MVSGLGDRTVVCESWESKRNCHGGREQSPLRQVVVVIDGVQSVARIGEIVDAGTNLNASPGNSVSNEQIVLPKVCYWILMVQPMVGLNTPAGLKLRECTGDMIISRMESQLMQHG